MAQMALVTFQSTARPSVQFARAVAFVFGITLLTSACAFKNEDETAKSLSAPAPAPAENVADTLQREKDREAADGILTTTNVSINFFENPMPDSYQMVIRWPKSIRNVTFRINDGPSLIKNNTDVADFAVMGGADQRIEMVAYGTVSPAPLSSVVLNRRSPNDLVVSKSISLSENRSMVANRIFFEAQGQILTNGFQLNIDANKILISDDPRVSNGDNAFTTLAKIVTFIPGTLATKEADLKGSVITINAKEAHGDLRIAMVGANGRIGKTGDEVERTLPPEEKASRTPAPPHPSLKGSAAVSTRDTFSRGSRGGPDGAGMGTRGVCQKDPTNGATGPEGVRGVQGGQGERGGNCGTLILNIEDSRNLRVEVRQKVGTPGAGGPGGAGFPGGIGGLPGDGDPKCSAAAAGAQGPAGPKGPDGPGNDNGDTANIPLGSTPFNLLPL